MSGGQFGGIEYDILNICDDISNILDENIYNEFTESQLEFSLMLLNFSSLLIRKIDRLICDDDSEETFRKFWENEANVKIKQLFEKTYEN